MKINQVSAANQLSNLERLQSQNNKPQKGGTKSTDNMDSFQKHLAEASADTSFSYSGLAVNNVNSMAVQSLMGEHDDIQGAFNQLITDLLKRQGYTEEQIQSGEFKDLDVDEIAQAEAQKMIGPGGDLSPEKVSDRIVNFAIAVTGNDKEKIDLIRSSIDRGFAEAEQMIGQLPEISKETYELIQEKLDKWLESDTEKTEKTPEDQ